MPVSPRRRGDPGFEVVRLPASRAGELADGLRRIYDRELDAVILEGLIPREEMAAAAAALAAGDDHFPRTPSEDHDLSVRQVYVLGMSMTPSRIHGVQPDMETYLSRTDAYRAGCRALFPPDDALLRRLVGAFEAMSGGRPVSVFQGPGGRPYTPTTIRAVPPGCEIPLHSGLEFLTLGAYRELIEGLDCSEQLSFFTVIDPPESGGELVVYRADHWDPEKPVDEQGSVVKQTIEEQADYDIFELGPGDLLVFAGGRWFHRVAPVEGAKIRRTIGGFMGFSSSRDAVHFWS
jgi:hypothetical protein